MTLILDYPGKRVAKRGWSLAVSALGACLWELHRSCIDTELLSINNFQVYKCLLLCLFGIPLTTDMP